MNRRLLIIPIVSLALVALLLLPAIPATIIWPKCTGLCPAFPPNGKALPDGSYSYTIFASLFYLLFKFGGMISPWGLYTIQGSSNGIGLTQFGVLLVVVSPLFIVTIAGFIIAYMYHPRLSNKNPILPSIEYEKRRASESKV
jgi:hypothetical protein